MSQKAFTKPNLFAKKTTPANPLAASNEAFPRNLPTNEEEKDDYVQDFSDEELDQEFEKEEARKKQEMLKQAEQKQIVRTYEDQKAKGLIKATDEPERGAEGGRFASSMFLDDLWAKIRNFLNDVNDKGERKELGPLDDGKRTQFANSCKQKDTMRRGYLSEKQMMEVFSQLRLIPLPSENELRMLYKALEVYTSAESSDILYDKILSATVKREHSSLNGIFPKIKAKGPSQKQIEEQKRKEEEERKKKEKADEEERKRKEIVDKRLQEQKKNEGYRRQTKEDQKMKVREEELKREAERKEQERKQKEETDAVRREVTEYKKSIAQIQKVILDSRENLRNWFKLFDDNNDDYMEFDEFKRLLQHVKVVVKDGDLKNLFEIMDLQQSGRISYNNFCDVIERNQTLPIESIVRKRRQDRGEKYYEADVTQRLGEEFDFGGSSQPFKSAFGEIGGSQRKDLGSVDGMSEILKRSEGDFDGRQLIQEDDTILIYNDMKEQLRSNYSTFDDLLQKMGRPNTVGTANAANKVLFKDFETLIKGMPTGYKYSTQQLRNVFKLYAQQAPSTFGNSLGAGEDYIPTMEFKDKFFPGVFYQRQQPGALNITSGVTSNSSFGDSLRSSALESKSESMHVDNILAGRKYEDVQADKQAHQEAKIREKELKYLAQGSRGGLGVINEDRYEVASQSSIPSRAIDDMLGNSINPRRNKNAPGGSKLNTAQNSLQNTAAGKGLQGLKQSELSKFQGNADFFRQSEAILKQLPLEERFRFDKTLDGFFKNFCQSLINEITNGPVKRDVASFVQHYGKEKAGFINYSEFKKIYEIHVQQIENLQMTAQQEEAILNALFKIFDKQSLGRVPLNDFVQMVLSQQSQSTVLDRLKNKVKKGGDRLINVLDEEFQQADIPYGCKGELPISNFQTIMIDYDLPFMESDLQDLRKKGMTLKDSQGHEFVRYKEILIVAKPKRIIAADTHELNRLIAKIQALWRGYQQRKRFNKNTFKDFRQLGAQFKRVGKGVQFKDQDENEKSRKASPKKMTPQQKKEELEKKKKIAIAQNKAKRKKSETLEARMGTVLKKNQDKLSEKQQQVKAEITDFIKNEFLNDLITKAQCYAESLILGRDIQRKFETRPVTRFVFPMIQEFQYNVMGVQPKTLQTLNELGQIMYLDSENQLNQYDIPTNKTLQQVNLGTRPPLKHYDIIDLVCDQTSGRIYTLNSNWILEIWNIEQNVSLPQKRLAVCTNEGNKDFISIYYKSTFNNAKPRFLSLSDHNQQILVVNTSCVDGSIVFIDPISFSVLKKIQLKYQDYEISKGVRQSITFLKSIFKNIIEKSGKTIFDIFERITNKDTQSCKIRDFATQLSFFDQTQKLEDIFKMCQELDEDGSGTITIDEFLHYFQYLDATTESDYERKKAEEEMYENVWPEWVTRENKLEFAKALIIKLFDCLRKTPNISPEQAFQIFDQKEKGLISVDNFKKILTMFFSDARLDASEIEFVLRLTHKTVDQQYMYREFCKFLDKRFVRTFKVNSGANDTSQNNSFSLNSDLKDSYLRELDRKLVKEASLNYVIRKSEELNLDLRAIFLKNDENNLSVIPRARFLRILESLPLGLLIYELEEIFDNDLNYDNYGNVDYTVILNSDIFVTLERQRLRKMSRKAVNTTLDLDNTQHQSVMTQDVDKLTDNRKVVVEDLIYIDDLEVLFYTTVAPKTSTIFVTNAKKLSSENSDSPQVEVVNLSNIQKKLQQQEQSMIAQVGKNDLMTNYYQLLAKLKGHKNSDPPTLHYVAQSGCLISGEKFLSESAYKPGRDTMPKTNDPSIPVSHKFQKSSQGAYETHADRQSNSEYKSEIIIWNIQKHMIELFQTNPPWRVPISKKFSAHNASIIDICYLQKAQLLVSTSTDQTIRFFDPISQSFELTDPNNIPHAQQRPGYYKPMLKELTKGNTTFKEVRRIYTSSDTACYSLRCLNIQNITLDNSQPDFKSQIEWLVGLRLGRPQWQGRKNTQIGFVCGYGIERVKIEVPAVHHDDLPPPNILKECEDLISVRRRRLVTAFQHNLPHRIEKIYSQVQLQNSYMAQIRKLFLEAILKRKELKYVNPEPLREIYKIILKLPNRTKFENFLAISGCSDKLSVSETFFYLQKFMQIHPLRTTQIEFEKSIEEFQKKHSREFLRGTKRWNKAAVQKFANYVKAHGLNIAYLERDNFQSTNYQQSSKIKVNDFCTRERFIQYFNEIVFHEQRFSDEEIDTVLNELDPFFTGVMQISLIQNYYREEIHFHNLTTLNRPKQIFQDIRGKVFPNKKLALQQSLVSVDVMGDGYINKEQFIEAFQKAEIKIDRDVLEFLFEVVAEKYDTAKHNSEDAQNQNASNDIKVLSITYFIKKLFNNVETEELNEIDQTLQNIKAALIYKGLDFSVVFAENSVENVKQKRQSSQSKLDKSNLDDTMALQKKLKDTQIDLTQHYTRFAQQLVSQEFCQRIEQLHSRGVSQENIRRLANFLALNQKNQSVIYLNSWLHHLRRVQTAFHQPNKAILPVICSKLLRNENVFRSYVDSTTDLKSKREEEKLIDVADLRSVLHRFGINYINQDFFINEFTRAERVHIEDLITRMKSCVQQAYNMATSTLNKSLDESNNQSSDYSRVDDMETLKDLKKTDYFDRVQMKLKTLQGKILLSEFVEKFKAFDPSLMGRIKIHHFINVLKYNYPEIFDSDTLIGLQFELECLNSDDCVDYEEFVKIFLERRGERLAPGSVDYFGETMQEIKLDKKSAYQIQDYEDLLSRLNLFLKQNGYDDLSSVMRIFKIFAKGPQGDISYEHLKKIFDMLGFIMTDIEFKLMINFADENRDGAIQFQEFANQIVYAKELASLFDINKWIVASRSLLSRYYLLDRISGSKDQIKDILISDFGSDGTHSGVLTGEQFQDLLRDAKLEFTEYEIDLVTVYAIKGSRRSQGSAADHQQVNTKNDLIQYYNLVKSLEPVVKHMRKEDDDNKKKQEEYDMFEDEITRFRKDIERREKEQEALNKYRKDPSQAQREQPLINKITEIFIEREVSFFDCFQQHYDPLNPKGSQITISQFKKAINTLNLPLTVQEHRILRRIADPQQIGKVDLQKFCMKFETQELRRRRLNHILEKISTAFYLQNFNLRRAFALFDRNGDGSISRREFREGWLTLNLGLTYDEIDELMTIVDTDKDGAVSYDEFISKMDIHIQKKSKYAAEQAKEVIFHKIRSLIELNSDSLYEIFSNYDYSHSGSILIQDLVRGFKRLGILHPEPHMKLLLEAGGARETDEKIDYVVYSQNLQGHIEKILGLSVKKNYQIMQKVNALISAKRMSAFEFFINLDVNNSGKVSKIEFKTGLQAFGINITNHDFANLWKLIKKPINKFMIKDKKQEMSARSTRSSRRGNESARSNNGQEIDQENENLSYYELLQGFITSGCFKFQKSVDNTNNLVNKFRQQLKKFNISVEKAYKQYDPEDHKFVFKHDFVNESLMMGLEFTEEELEKIFEYICQVGVKGTESNNQQKQQLDRKQQKSTTRFSFKQLHDAVLVKRDENWLFQSFIKIHGVVLQKNLSYKRLFAQWREKGSKTAVGRLSSKELKAGLKKLRAGLTQDEIEKLTSSVPFEGKDNSIAAADFERLVVQGAKKLEQEKSYQKLIIQEWITIFNNSLDKQKMPVERVFAEHDTEQQGSLNFEEFAMLNDYVGMGMNKKELKRVFDIVDRTKSGRVRLEEIKSISSLLENEGDENLLTEEEEQNMKLKGEELKTRQDLDDLYEQVKDKLEKKNTTLETIIFDQLKYMPNQFANVKGVQQVFEKLGITLSSKETEKVLQDVRNSNSGRYECSFKEFVDFMTRRRINVAFFDKGFVDPLIASCCQQVNKTVTFYDLSVEKLFGVFDKEKDGKISKEVFIKCIQGMDLGISIEDLIEFFNYLDDRNENIITKMQFVDGITFVVSKIGGGSKLEQALAQGVQQTKKGSSIKQQVFNVLKKIADAIQAKRFSMRQVLALFDKERTGFISRSDFALTVKSIEGGVSLDEARMLMNFFDDKNTGKLSVIEFAKALQEIMNNQTGGGIYAFMQVQPILQRIINELAVDCDKFFDEVADLNEQLAIEEMRQEQDEQHGSHVRKSTRSSAIGLSKGLFYTHLQRYGVQLDDDEKTLLNTVFSISDSKDKFDYEKLDSAFEGVQQQLYQHETFYTVEWQRRIFKKIGDYLRKNNLTIHKCFNLIDEDNSQSITIQELKNAIIRFQLDISDRELEVFMKRIAGEENKTSVTQQQFIKMFWSAYTYEDIFSDQTKNRAADPTRPLGARVEGLSDRIKNIRMFGAIQQKIKMQANAQTAFKMLDKGVGFLALKDFQNFLPQNFSITLKQDEVLKLFKEVDRDRDGLVKYKEFEQFYNEDYEQRLKDIEQEKKAINYQHEIFDHLMKVLHQKSLTLAEVFDQIDTNQNGYIECDEFQNLLERLGFTISEAQVYELMRQIDENFDGKISYKELRDHIRSLGFSMGLDNTNASQSMIKYGDKRRVEPHVWRDKGVELVIRTLKAHLNKKPFEDYFKKFDTDHDNHLSPSEFRLSLMSLKDAQLKKFQIERIMHILLDEKKNIPVISISKVAKFLRTYQYIDKESVQKGNNTTAVLIDEDLFVYIVEKYDGFSRLVDIISQFDEKASYIQRHVFEINLRGLNMLSNQKTVEKLHKKAIKLNELFESSLVLLAGEAGRLIKEEAQLCVLDPSHNINTITNDQNAGVLASIQIPTIENSAFDIDFATLSFLPSGAQRYMGVMSDSTRRKVEVLIFPNDDLNYVSSDGKTYKKHLSLELQVHRYLMGNHFNGEVDLDTDPNNMDIFPNVGKFEKKIGLAASDKEIYVVNEMVDEDSWISLDEFVHKNGGILNIPLFYHTDAPLFIIRYWAQKLLQIINKLHEVSIVGRSFNLSQVYISRDGQRMKLAHLRGVGKVNNLGYVKECPDIYLTLENNSLDERYNGGQSSTISPGGHGGAASSSKRTEAQKSFSNRALDNPFLAPEILFQKFTEHTSALDVWSFGMIMYSVLLGQKPESFYSIYRAWYKMKHGYDIELATLPFIPPSQSNFIYDPFSVDFDNPFNTEEIELNQDLHIDLPGSLMEKRSHLNFENVMKCIKNLSNSSLFENGNSKKFQFKSLAQDIRENNNPNILSDQPPRFAGQSHTNQEMRRKVFSMFAKAEVLERKNELGLILDLISSCLDMDPKRRPTINGLLNSPLFKLDNYEMTNAVRFSQNVILYRSPQSSVSLRITAPLRSMCSVAIKNPFNLFSMEADILKVFMQTEECISHISSLPIDQINSVLTENEKRKSLLNSTMQAQFRGKDFSQLRVSPNSPLAAQIIEDKVIDMLLFLTLRYTKTFNEWKTKRLTEIGKETQGILKLQQEKSVAMSQSSKRKSVKFESDALTATDGQSIYQSLNQSTLQKKLTERLQNLIIQKMANLLRTLVYEMHSYATPLSPFVKEVLEYVVKFYTGEEYELGSDYVLRKTSGVDSTLKDYLRGRSFFRREAELSESFKSDNTDKQWHLEQKNKTFLDKSNHWNTELHKEALRIYKDAVTESGMGQSCYPVINDFITNVTNSFEPSKVFSNQMNQLCLSFLIPMNRTAFYYNELIPLTECLARLYSPELEKAGKRCALAVIRSVFQTGSSDKIKACLDMRVPKHIIHFLQDSDSEVRHECLLIFYEISKGLQDDDFEILGKSAANLKTELSKRAHRKTAFDAHKTLSLVSQQEDIVLRNKQEEEEQKTGTKKKRGQAQQSQADMMSNYIKRTTALIEKNDNEKFINFALDLPNLNFLSNKRFLREMAICFESPVFIAPLIRLLKSPIESYQNKETILQIIFNLFCGNEKVLIAINSPACDTYMTLLKMLMQNSKIQSAKISASGLSAQMRQQLALQEKVVELFRYMFEQRRPTIIRDLGCIGASATLLKEQNLFIPQLINLPEIVAFVDEFNHLENLTADMIQIDDFLSVLKDLRCWIKHFYNESQIPELTRIKALQRCVNLIIKVMRILWEDFPNQSDRRADYLILIKAGMQLIDWLCVRNQEHFIFNEQNGKYNLEFIIEQCNYALSAFRRPSDQSRVPMEELAHNAKNNKEVQKTRKYDMFPFTEIGAILQNILYQLVRKNVPLTNELLSEANFGFVFGEQLILEYDFIRHCIDNKIESMVLIDTYVKKNEIRLNTLEYLLSSSEHTLKSQFIKSNFIDKLFGDYIQDFREFNIQFSKIDLEFLAFRKTFPIRLECISIINTTLMQKHRAPNVFTEVIMYAKRHFLIKNEVSVLRLGKMSTEESTVLLLFSVILESNEEDLVYAMMQEGAHKVIRDMMKEFPTLNKKFPILAQFTNKF